MAYDNIILFYPSFEKGGVEEIIKNLIIFNKTKKKKIFLITNENKQVRNIERVKNLHILSKLIKKNIFLPYRVWSSIICSIELFKILKRFNKSNTLIHSMQSNIFSILVARLKGFKIAIRNSEDPISSIKFADNKITAYFIFLIRFIFYNLPDKIITNSKGSADSLKLFTFGKNKKKINFIYNPYLSIKKKKLGKKSIKKKKIILGVGRLTSQKNFKNLIIAFKESRLFLKDYKLLIIGDGSEKKELINLIKNYKLENYIKLKGYQKNTEKFFIQSKLFVLPSKYEGLGNVLIDAINFNVPCIATDCKSGPKEILCNGKGGLIVKNDNINSLTQALIKAIKNYKESKKKMNIAKKKLYRFEIWKQSQKYFNELDKT